MIMRATSMPPSRRTPQVMRMQLEASRTAVELQGLANRFAHLGLSPQSEQITRAADELAKAVFDMGPVRALDGGTFAHCFPHLWQQFGLAPSQDDEDE